MRKLSNLEVKGRQLKLFDEFARYCDEHNLMYSLAFGTLIGAIRHKGYIPWDDDVDVWMPYPDYIKFFNGYESNNDFEIQNISVSKSYTLSFGRLADTHSIYHNRYFGNSYGVSIDIYPVCGLDMPESFIDIYIKTSKLKLKYQKLYQFSKLLGLLKLSGLTENLRAQYILKIEKEYGKFGYEDSQYVFPFTRRLVMEKKLFNSVVDVEFEGRKYKAFRGYDAILRMIYGDYMQLPPEKDQKPHHGCVYYDKE